MKSSFGSLKQEIFDKQARKQQYQDYVRGLNAYDRHKRFLNDYIDCYGKQKCSPEIWPTKTDQDTLREGYRFIRTEEDDMNSSWEQRLVKRYYDKLFKEYCIADMSRYKTDKIGLRWRTEKEVISGKGQFECGNKHCNEKDGLSSYEVNFSYFEAGENKQALVKLVACERCAEKLYYKKQKEKEKEELKRKEYEKHRTKRDRSDSDDDDDDDDRDIADRRSKDRRKGKKASTSANARQDEDDDDENFDEYLEGMFP